MVVVGRAGIQGLSEMPSPNLIHILQVWMTDKVKGDSIASSVL